ncbi:MAG: preprotein translocase subunit SecG [Pseudomonadota bacterium]
MTTVLISIHIMLVLALIVLVLLQRSEGGALGIGGGGGGGGGGGFMSARGAANALTKTTSIIAAGFFLTSIALGVVASNSNRTNTLIERIEGTGGAATGVPTEEGTSAPAGGNLLEDLESLGQPTAPSTGVPTSE